jgi:tetratricopeptide (TPR) repeat protein
MDPQPLREIRQLIDAGAIDDALAALDALLAGAPDDLAARGERAALLLRLRTPAALLQALADLDALRAAAADQPPLRSRVLEAQGDMPGAIDALGAIPLDSPEADRLVSLLVAAGRHDEALAICARQGATWGWVERAGDVEAARGRMDRTISHYRAALALADQDAPPALRPSLQRRLHMVLGHAYRRTGQPEAARAHYMAAMASDARDPVIGFNLGLVAAMTGDLAGAHQLCADALRGAPPALRDAMLAELRQPAGSAIRDLLGDPPG